MYGVPFMATAVLDNWPRAIETFLTSWHDRHGFLRMGVPCTSRIVASGILLDAGYAVSGREKMQKLKEQTIENGLFYLGAVALPS